MAKGYSQTVEVITNVKSHGTEEKQTFENVSGIHISDGHVSLNFGQTIVAVFAPGTWQYVRRQPAEG